MTFTFPAPRTVPLRSGPVLRWGVLGPGEIAGDFVASLHANTDQRVEAVGSRSAARAEQFASVHGIARAYGDYAGVILDPGVDIVYVAVPNGVHGELALAAIAGGKHVLIEKPMALDAAEAREIAAAARAAGVFAMEAMWSRFLPQTDVVRHLLDRGDLGQVALVTADFGANFSDLPDTHHVFDPAMGGVLRDIGIYALWFARFVLGDPRVVCASGHLTAGGVDGQVSMILSGEGGAQALLSATMLADTPVTASISGSRARIEMRSPFLMPDGFELITESERFSWTEPTGLRLREGLAWQAVAVAQDVADGRTESALYPLEETIRLLETIDEIRAMVGQAAQ